MLQTARRDLAVAAFAASLAGAFAAAQAQPADPAPSAYRADAVEIEAIVRANYAYLDELPGGVLARSPQLDAARDAVHDRASLLHYAEDVLATLADHHAITGSSFGDDWAVVPSYADLWLVRAREGYRVDAVRDGSPAERAGIRPGFRLAEVGGVPVDAAVAQFWARLGLPVVGERADYAARVLAAGRRDRARTLGFVTPAGLRRYTLENLYRTEAEQPELTVSRAAGKVIIRFNNSLGDLKTIAAFDRVMAALPGAVPIVLDLTDTPSGGTTSVARAIMGWFTRKPSPYQMHRLPAEQRATGIERQWVEYVLPRAGRYHPGPVEVRVGRWTGSMGEGLAAGFLALGQPVCGTRMAGLKGAVYDFDLPNSGLRIKLPAERLYTVAGQPRHELVPARCPTRLS